jgi:TrmH family RNA methyltransferase
MSKARGIRAAVSVIRKLGSRRGREETGCFTAEGVRLVEEVLESRWAVDFLAYTAAAAGSPRTAALLDRARARGLQPVVLDERRMKSLSGTVTPQGVLAVVRRPARDWTELLDRSLSLVVILDGLQDPGNVGTVIRAADAAACDGVVCLPGTSDPFGPKAVRSSMGSVLHLPVYTGVPAQDLSAGLVAQGVRLLVADPGGESVPAGEDLRGPVALVLGSEARGPGASWQGLGVTRVRIPMPGRAESLNVALAAGVILYETVRQRS